MDLIQVKGITGILTSRGAETAFEGKETFQENARNFGGWNRNSFGGENMEQ